MKKTLLLFFVLLTTQINAQYWQTSAGGISHTVALKTDGTLWAWGSNNLSQLGDGTTTSRNTPIRIGTANDWKNIAATGHHTIAIKTDGTLWAWGRNTFGQLGDGTTTTRNTPTQIGTATDWQTIAAGENHTIAIKTDGSLWAWGENTYTQLGDGTTTNRSIPTQIGTETDWKTIAGAGIHTVALKTTGTLWTWGDNGNGQLGDNTSTAKSIPTQIGTATDWKTIGHGRYHTVAIKTDGTLWAWGYNGYGNLGDGTTTLKRVPTQIGTATDWQTIAGGLGYCTIATKTDASLWAWGRNNKGQLGDGTTTDRNTPTQIGTATNWQIVATGFFHTLALKTDSTLWTWGWNTSSQLGDDTTTDRDTPTAISSPVAPTVTTTTQTNVGAIRATLGGDITADGGPTVTERGIVWATATDPSTADNKVINGAGLGSFSAIISALPPATLVYYRAYAINSAGTGYGTTISFTTAAALSASTSQTNVVCTGDTNGSASVTASGGASPYTYLWSSSKGTSATATELSAIAYTCTITDDEGTSIVKNFSITADDLTPPAAISKNFIAYLDASGSVTINASDLNNGSTDNCGIASYTMTIGTTGTVCDAVTENNNLAITAPEGSKFTAVDFANYGTTTGSCGSFVVGSCNASNSVSVVSSYLIGQKSAIIPATNAIFGDPCDGTGKSLSVQASYGPTEVSLATKTYTCADLGDHTVTLTVTDVNGNSSTTTATVTVKDAILPTVVTQTATVQLNASGQATVTATQINNGSSDNCGIASVTVSPSAFTCANLGENTVTLTVTDTSGNINTATAVVTVQDNITPLCGSPATGIVPEILYYKFDGTGASIPNLASAPPAGSENATINGAITQNTSGICGIGSLVGTGNSSLTDYINTNWNTNLGSDWTISFKTSNIPSLSSSSPSYIFGDVGASSFRCFTGGVAGSNNWILRGPITDVYVNGGATVASHTITFVYSQTAGNIKAYLDGVLVSTVVQVAVNISSASTLKVGGYSSSTGLTSGGMMDEFGIYNRSLSAAEVAQLSSCPTAATTSCPTNVSLVNTAGTCGVTYTYVTPTPNDNCTVTLTQTSGLASGGIFPIGTTTNTFVATDSAGNTATCSFDVTVQDVVSPTALTQDITIQLDATGNATLTAAQIDNGSTDDCGIASITVSPNTFNCSNVGLNNATLVTLTVTDVHGNVSTNMATVTVQDSTAPTILTQDITVQLDATGNASITASQIDNGSTDNCEIASVTVSPTNFDCTKMGPNTVTLTVTDVNGNASTATAIVTVNSLSVNTITRNSDTLTADETDATTYQWMTYNGGIYANILNETNQSLSVKAAGSYAVDITKNGCTQRSAVFDMTTLGNKDFDFKSKLSVYPNPFNDAISITIDTNAKVEIYNLLGETIYSKKINSGTTQLDLGNHASGMYLIKATNENNQSKMVKAIKK
jgi:alpha-tubulin suppressor-like RCC1 family protein